MASNFQHFSIRLAAQAIGRRVAALGCSAINAADLDGSLPAPALPFLNVIEQETDNRRLVFSQPGERLRVEGPLWPPNFRLQSSLPKLTVT